MVNASPYPAVVPPASAPLPEFSPLSRSSRASKSLSRSFGACIVIARCVQFGSGAHCAIDRADDKEPLGIVSRLQKICRRDCETNGLSPYQACTAAQHPRAVIASFTLAASAAPGEKQKAACRLPLKNQHARCGVCARLNSRACDRPANRHRKRKHRRRDHS